MRSVSRYQKPVGQVRRQANNAKHKQTNSFWKMKNHMKKMLIVCWTSHTCPRVKSFWIPAVLSLKAAPVYLNANFFGTPKPPKKVLKEGLFLFFLIKWFQIYDFNMDFFSEFAGPPFTLFQKCIRIQKCIRDISVHCIALYSKYDPHVFSYHLVDMWKWN